MLPKTRIFGTNAPSEQGRIQGGRLPTLKSKKVTLFTMVLYNSENYISKPILNKTFVMFQLSYCSRSRPFCCPLFFHSFTSLLSAPKPLWNWLPLKYPTLTLLAGPALPLKWETAQYHQTICTVKSHSRALATFQNIGKIQKQGEAIWIKYVFCSYFDKILCLF